MSRNVRLDFQPIGNVRLATSPYNALSYASVPGCFQQPARLSLRPFHAELRDYSAKAAAGDQFPMNQL